MAVPIMCSNIAVELKPAPLKPSWVRGGNPIARNMLLSRSHDGTAETIIWDCTPGQFEWRYGVDETIHILEGSIVLDDGSAPPRRLGPGDVVFFPAGAVVHWTVETHVRKLAFFRATVPKPLVGIARLWGKGRSLLTIVKSRLRRSAGRRSAEA